MTRNRQFYINFADVNREYVGESRVSGPQQLVQPLLLHFVHRHKLRHT